MIHILGQIFSNLLLYSRVSCHINYKSVTLYTDIYQGAVAFTIPVYYMPVDMHDIICDVGRLFLQLEMAGRLSSDQRYRIYSPHVILERYRRYNNISSIIIRTFLTFY